MRTSLTRAANDVLLERERQITREGWTTEHDDSHVDGQLALAASCYALPTAIWEYAPHNWPWATSWWKPRDRRRNLVRAGALILAEIERLDRSAPPKEKE